MTGRTISLDEILEKLGSSRFGCFLSSTAPELLRFFVQ